MLLVRVILIDVRSRTYGKVSEPPTAPGTIIIVNVINLTVKVGIPLQVSIESRSYEVESRTACTITSSVERIVMLHFYQYRSLITNLIPFPSSFSYCSTILPEIPRQLYSCDKEGSQYRWSIFLPLFSINCDV